jgi:TolA-binding protein
VAQYNFALGYYLTAAKDFQRLLGVYPQSGLRAEAYYWLGSSKLAIGAADSAAFYFRKVIDEHGGSSMASWSVLGLADAYYIDQDFPRAKSQCQTFLDSYPRNSLIPVALFRLAEIHVALGERDRAVAVFSRVLNEYPGTYQGKAAQRQLNEWGGPDEDAGQKKEFDRGTYAIQVGAFSKRTNALVLEGQLSSWGYDVEVVKRAGRHRTLYLVWTGQYGTREEATTEAKILERERGLPYQIIKR